MVSAKVSQSERGFEHSWSRFDILGYCSECSANDSGNRIQQSIDHVTAALENIEESASQLRQAIELHESRKLSRGHALVQSATDKMRKALADCESSLTLLNKESVS